MFYCQRMRGEILVEQLIQLGKARLDYLNYVWTNQLINGIYENSINERTELEKSLPEIDHEVAGILSPLIETIADCGSQKDQVSYCLLLLLARASSREFRFYLLERESRLFAVRLREDMTQEQIIRSFTKIRRFYKRRRGLQESIQKEAESNYPSRNEDYLTGEICAVLDVLHSNAFLSHWLENHRNENANENLDCQILIPVTFQLVIPLVAKRAVILQEGKAFITCDYIPMVLESIFRHHLSTEMEQGDLLTSDLLVEDTRTKKILDAVKVHYHKLVRAKRPKQSTSRLSAESVPQEVPFFPLCMRLIHDKLALDHRKLEHTERYHFTLFLKDIGMDIDDALAFWCKQYSKISSGRSNLWEEKREKYKYGIRHIYGLEGHKRGYGGFSCGYLQTQVDGICPFTLDIEDLDKVLRRSRSGSMTSTDRCQPYQPKVEPNYVHPSHRCFHHHLNENATSEEFVPRKPCEVYKLTRGSFGSKPVSTDTSQASRRF